MTVKHYEIIPGTEVWNVIVEANKAMAAWTNDSYVSEFIEKIGVSPRSNLVCRTDMLMLVKTNEGKRDQFCKTRYAVDIGSGNVMHIVRAYKAKVTSRVALDYADLVSKYDLKSYDTEGIAQAIGPYWKTICIPENMESIVLVSLDLDDAAHEEIMNTGCYREIPDPKYMDCDDSDSNQQVAA